MDEETRYSRERGSASEIHKLPQVLVAGVDGNMEHLFNGCI